MTTINNKGTDWLVMRSHLNTLLADLHRQMEDPLVMEEYHKCRGAIYMIRQIIEWAEPTAPVPTQEDNYDISDPNQGSYT